MSDPRLATALEHHRAGRYADAEFLYRQILTQNPNDPEANHFLGALALKTGHADHARSLFLRAIQLKPDYALAHNNLGNLYLAARDLPHAVASLRRALELDPSLPEIHTSLGHALADQGFIAEALPHFQKAAACQPTRYTVHSDLADALARLGHTDQAIAAYRQSLDLNPHHVPALVNLGIHLTRQGHAEQALTLFHRAVTLDPAIPEAHWNHGLLLLLLGRLAEGWPEFEYRWQCKESSTQPRHFIQPQWTGEPLAGKTILVHAEQGFGDTIQFTRYLPLLSNQNAAVLLECPSELHALLQSLSSPPRLLVPGNPLPPFDYHTPLLSLPRLFHTTLETIPHVTPYLSADPALVTHFQQLLTESLSASTPQNSRRVGIAWAGHPRHAQDAARSLPISLLAPLAAISDLTFISLQTGAAASHIPAAGIPIINLANHLPDFAHTAALISNLDLVITVDTAVAHLAGALAKPTWLLLPHTPDWRWLLNRSDSPWYPTMRLFRQPSPGNWPAVIEQVAHELRSRSTSNTQRE